MLFLIFIVHYCYAIIFYPSGINFYFILTGLFYSLLLHRKSVRRINVPTATRKLRTFSNGCCERAPPLQVDVTRRTLERGMFSYILCAILEINTQITGNNNHLH